MADAVSVNTKFKILRKIISNNDIYNHNDNN